MDRREINERAGSARSVCRMLCKDVGELVNNECLSPWHRERMHRFKALISDAEDQLLLLSLELKEAEEAKCAMDK